MKRLKGFTLFELLITLTIICITLTLTIPSFNKQIRHSRTKTATLALLGAIENSRSIAVFKNSRTMLLATDKKWHKGWVLFIDNNSDGKLGGDEEIIAANEKLDGVFLTANAPMDTYISFIGTGEGKQIGSSSRGGFLAGTIKICPEQEGEGYALVLSKGGRTRVGKLKAEDCDSLRK